MRSRSGRRSTQKRKDKAPWWGLLPLMGSLAGLLGAGLQLRQEASRLKEIRRDRVYDLAEAAHLLKVPPGQLRRQIELGILPARRIGEEVRFLGQSLVEYLQPEPPA